MFVIDCSPFQGNLLGFLDYFCLSEDWSLDFPIGSYQFRGNLLEIEDCFCLPEDLSLAIQEFQFPIPLCQW